jgi:DNA-3-methyladenine glycosylase
MVVPATLYHSCSCLLIQVGQALGLSTDWSNHPLYTPGMIVLSPVLPETVRWYCLKLLDVADAYLSTNSFSVSGGLEVLDGPEPENVLVGPRVGIDYASSEHVAAPWRFAVAGTAWISAPKNTLRPR